MSLANKASCITLYCSKSLSTHRAIFSPPNQLLNENTQHELIKILSHAPIMSKRDVYGRVESKGDIFKQAPEPYPSLACDL